MYDERMNSFLLNNDLSTYDPYDIWKTNIGIKIKKVYYKNKYLGILPAGILTIFDLYINNNFRVGYKKQEYPIVRAQAALALINMYKDDNNDIYLEYAKKHIDWLILNSSKGYSGYCWGLNFDWIYTSKKIYDSNTPFSTHTPYPLEAIIEYYNITKDSTLLEVIKSVFLFLENDIKIMKEDENILIVSYGAEYDRIVTNANAYVMYMYALLLKFLPEKQKHIETKIKKIYQFLVSVQNSDGSWIYQPYDDDSFIDCFHSVFVVKNILKTNSLYSLEHYNKITKNGFAYIKEHFLDDEYGLYKRFSKSNKVSLVKFDLYDNAEMLHLALLMEDENISNSLHTSIVKNFCKNNDIYSLIDLFSSLKNKNHFRWAVVPYLYALTEIKEK